MHEFFSSKIYEIPRTDAAGRYALILPQPKIQYRRLADAKFRSGAAVLLPLTFSNFLYITVLEYFVLSCKSRDDRIDKLTCIFEGFFLATFVFI